MNEKGFVLSFLLILFGINFIGLVSAQFYRGLSLSDLLNSFDSSTVILTSIFLIAFILIFWPLSKFFRENALLAGIISFAMSFLLIFEINRRGLDFAGFFYSIGISGGILYTIAPLILLVGFFLISYSKLERKFKFYRGFFVLGGLLIGIVIFTDIFYSEGTTFILGVIFSLIGVWLWRRGRRSGFEGSYYQNYDTYSGSSQRQIYKQQRAQQKYQEKLAEQERQAHEAEVRRRAGKIAKYDWEREKREARAIGRGVSAVGKGAWKAGKYVASKYDWEKEKRQAAAIRKGAKKAWSETFAGGRNMSHRRAEKQAYKEQKKDKK
ncbi:MAG: hypothetical protein IIA85_03485 [Nanoarchaeota archaeon]|nr:hypothetical protein [Nanoarchaeota archaeon]